MIVSNSSVGSSPPEPVRDSELRRLHKSSGNRARQRNEHTSIGRGALIVDGRMLFSSGIGRYLREILRRVPEAHRAFGILCNSPEQHEWVKKFVPSSYVIESQAALYSVKEQMQAWRFPRSTTYWVPHYNVPWLTRCRLIATVHDLAPLAVPDMFGGRVRRWAAQFYFQAIRKRTARIITVSRFTRGELSSRGISAPSRVSVVRNGVDAFWFSATAVKQRSHRLLYVGNLKPHKNLGRLVEAIALSRKMYPIELDVVGRIDGFRAGLTSRLIEQLRSTPWIHLQGETSDERLRQHYQEADALVFPSLYEGFGLPVLEAMAAGCQVLSSNAGALKEISDEAAGAGQAIDYFDPFSVQAISATLLRHYRRPESDRPLFQARGREIASRYSWDKAAAATWRLVSECSDS